MSDLRLLKNIDPQTVAITNAEKECKAKTPENTTRLEELAQYKRENFAETYAQIAEINDAATMSIAEFDSRMHDLVKMGREPFFLGDWTILTSNMVVANFVYEKDDDTEQEYRIKSYPTKLVFDDESTPDLYKTKCQFVRAVWQDDEVKLETAVDNAGSFSRMADEEIETKYRVPDEFRAPDEPKTEQLEDIEIAILDIVTARRREMQIARKTKFDTTVRSGLFRDNAGKSDNEILL